MKIYKYRINKRNLNRHKHHFLLDLQLTIQRPINLILIKNKKLLIRKDIRKMKVLDNNIIYKND